MKEEIVLLKTDVGAVDITLDGGTKVQISGDAAKQMALELFGKVTLKKMLIIVHEKDLGIKRASLLREVYNECKEDMDADTKREYLLQIASLMSGEPKYEYMMNMNGEEVSPPQKVEIVDME